MNQKPAPISGVEKLDAAHRLDSFDSGKPALDEWLKKYALTNQKSDSAKTYVIHRDKRIVGYYSLVAGSVSTVESTKRAAKGQPRKGTIPVVTLARLAVDRTEQGQGFGKALLKDALLRCEQAADTIGVRAVLVHALDKAAMDFYKKFEFEPSVIDEMTLMLLMKDIRGNT